MNFEFVKLAQDAKAAELCRLAAKANQDVVCQALWQELQWAYEAGSECSRGTVLWMLKETTDTIMRSQGADDLSEQDTQAQAGALYLRRLYP